MRQYGSGMLGLHISIEEFCYIGYERIFIPRSSAKYGMYYVVCDCCARAAVTLGVVGRQEAQWGIQGGHQDIAMITRNGGHSE